ncbi:MAG: hypothetical protein KTR31_03340 [Myxococcales bacterium]|nr:hypothetical protein [Myxococcales bacterium]
MLDRGVPPSGRLETVALYLAEHEHHRQVILFVERWAKHAPPTDRAQLVLAHAYARLRLLDRASTQLQRLSPSGRKLLEAEQLSAEVLLLRGSSKRALEAAAIGLERAPDDPVFLRIAQQARGPSLDPDRETTIPDVGSEVARAEAYMARGALVRARAILEQLRRRAHPRKLRRVEDLLWALRGEFGTTASLAELCARFGPTSADGFETTEQSAPGSELEEEPPPVPSSDRFPSLFRQQTPLERTTAERDRTQVSRMADTADLKAEPTITREGTHPRHRDTEILHVVPRSAVLALDAAAPNGLDLPPPHPESLATPPPYNPLWPSASPVGSPVEPPEEPVVVSTWREDTEERAPTEGRLPASTFRPPAGTATLSVGDVDRQAELERDAIRQHAEDVKRLAALEAREARKRARREAKMASATTAPPPEERANTPAAGVELRRSSASREAPRVLTAQELEEASALPWWVGLLVAMGAAMVATFAAIMFAAAI